MPPRQARRPLRRGILLACPHAPHHLHRHYRERGENDREGSAGDDPGAATPHRQNPGQPERADAPGAPDPERPSLAPVRRARGGHRRSGLDEAHGVAGAPAHRGDPAGGATRWSSPFNTAMPPRRMVLSRTAFSAAVSSSVRKRFGWVRDRKGGGEGKS